MKLQLFLNRSSAFSSGFWASYLHPLLLEEGSGLDREVLTLRGKTPESPIVIGREAPSDVLIADRRVSGQHVRLHRPTTQDGPWRIEDLGSTNGTILDGELLVTGQEVALLDGARLLLGPGLGYQFLLPETFRALTKSLKAKAPVSQPSQEELQDGKTLRVDPPQVGPAQVDMSPAPRRSNPGQALFLYCDGFDPVPLEDGARVVLGRKEGHADFVLPHVELSRRHCEVRRDGATVRVRDLGSTNGTQLDGLRLGPGLVELYPRRHLSLGPFRVWLDGPVEPTNARTLRLNTSTGEVQGRLEDHSLRTVVLEIESESRVGVLEVRGEGVSGRVAFAAGRPHQAETSSGDVGTGAIRRLLDLSNGSYVLRSLDEPTDGPSTVSKSFSEILAG